MSEKINNRQNWIFGERKSILKCKEDLRESFTRYMFVRTSRIFHYENLPETLPQRELERLLQIGRYAIIKKVKDNIFAFTGGLGGQPNEYYLPTSYTIANPYLNEFKIGKLDDYIKNDSDVVLLWNDSEHIGLLPMYDMYASLLSENVISMRIGLVNARIPSIANANSDTVKDSAEEFFKQIDDEGEFKVIVGEELLNGLKSLDIQSFNNARVGTLKDLIETWQYIKGSWFNEVGLNANFNMKRESINESESSLNEDALLPLIDDMLECRKKGVEEINKKFGTNITVELTSSWKKQREEIELRNKAIKQEEVVEDESINKNKND